MSERAAIRLDGGLEMAAQSWFELMTDLEREDLLRSEYSTAGNGFLIACEEAYFREVRWQRNEAAQREVEEAERLRLNPATPDSEWGVYELVDVQDVTFYVGMTGRPKRRLATHRREFREHIHAVLWHSVSSRREALDLETQMIVDLTPRMNIAKVPS